MPRNRRGWAFQENDSMVRSAHTPLFVSMLEPALLLLIKESDQHGYLLVAGVSALGMGSIHPSVIYRTLRDLERLGWAVSDWQSGQSLGPPRRIYRLTDLGEKTLAAWQVELRKAGATLTALNDRIDKVLERKD